MWHHTKFGSIGAGKGKRQIHWSQHHIQQLAAANLYRKIYIYLLNAAAFCLLPAAMNFDVFP